MGMNAIMNTSLQSDHASCSYCLNSTRTRLLENKSVHDVRMDAATGCWQISHDFEKPEMLEDLLAETLRGWTIASNGEIELASPSLTSRECTIHPHGVAQAGPTNL
jgi:hypothetical protein